MPIMVVNVDTWGAGGNQLSRGDEVSSEVASQVDMQWAIDNKVVVTAEEYQQEHPEWRPPGARDADKDDAEGRDDLSAREARASGTDGGASGTRPTGSGGTGRAGSGR